MSASNFSPFFTFGMLSIFVTIFFISEAFFGWESTTYLAEETKNPEKVIPLALVIGTIVVGIHTGNHIDIESKIIIKRV